MRALCQLVFTKRLLLFQVILQHFYRAGQLEIGESLAAEAGLADEQGKKAGKEPFMEMNRILEALGNRDLGEGSMTFVFLCALIETEILVILIQTLLWNGRTPTVPSSTTAGRPLYPR